MAAAAATSSSSRRSNTSGSTAEEEPPLVLRRVDRRGRCCSSCAWHRFCLGCALALSNERLVTHHNAALAIDWNESFYHEHVDFAEMTNVIAHPSTKLMAPTMSKGTRDVTFADCMALFTIEERLEGDSAPYCSECKKRHAAQKRLELWSTPPILVIHLKRLLQTRKLRTSIGFLLHGFDPSPFLVVNNNPNVSETSDDDETDADNDTAAVASAAEPTERRRQASASAR